MGGKSAGKLNPLQTPLCSIVEFAMNNTFQLQWRYAVGKLVSERRVSKSVTEKSSKRDLETKNCHATAPSNDTPEVNRVCRDAYGRGVG